MCFKLCIPSIIFFMSKVTFYLNFVPELKSFKLLIWTHIMSLLKQNYEKQVKLSQKGIVISAQKFVPILIQSCYFFIKVFVDMGALSTDTATLAFTFTGTSTTRIWEIKVTQVECSNPSRFIISDLSMVVTKNDFFIR